MNVSIPSQNNNNDQFIVIQFQCETTNRLIFTDCYVLIWTDHRLLRFFYRRRPVCLHNKLFVICSHGRGQTSRRLWNYYILTNRNDIDAIQLEFGNMHGKQTGQSITNGQTYASHGLHLCKGNGLCIGIGMCECSVWCNGIVLGDLLTETYGL